MSTGPKTVEGKLKSRRNSIKHGLTSNVVVAEDLPLVQERSADWFFSIHPQNEFQAWMVDKASIYSVRIDRVERMERRLRDRNALKAEIAWDDDRRIEAEELGSKLKSNPSEVARKLRRSPAGCDWMILRWSLLAEAADDNNKTWTPEQAELAYDLLGTPAEFRKAQALGVALAPDDNAALARVQVAELLEVRKEVADLDEVDRSLTESDLFDESHPELKRLRRYEGTLHNRLRWCLAQARMESPHFKSPPELVRGWQSGILAEAEAETGPGAMPPVPAAVVLHEAKEAREAKEAAKPRAPHPPFDLSVDELPQDGSKPDLLKILLNRHEKRERKAEARREARRRKTERLRM